MIFGVRAHDMGKGSLEAMLQGVTAHGFSTVQLTMTDLFDDFSTDQLTPGLAAEFRRAFADAGVGIAALSCYINPVAPDKAFRQSQLATFDRYLAFAGELGCGVVATETGSLAPGGGFHPANHEKAAMDTLLKSLDHMTNSAARAGLRVAVEGVKAFVIHDVPSMRYVLDRFSPAVLSAIFDPVNLMDASNCAGQTALIRDAFHVYGERMTAVHLKDYTLEDGRLRGAPVGAGAMDLQTLLPLAKARALPLILEEQSPDTVNRSLARLRSLSEQESEARP